MLTEGFFVSNENSEVHVNLFEMSRKAREAFLKAS